MIWLTALLVQASAQVIILEHSRSTAFSRTTYETRCRKNRVKIVYGSDPPRVPLSRVESFEIDGKPVSDALAVLRWKAAGRSVDSVHIMNCDFDRPDPVLQGVMSLGMGPGRTSQFPPRAYFGLKREGKSWRLIDLPARPAQNR